VPKISVVMSVYNGERFLKQSVDSIINQSFSDFEFIIINDASTDSTLKILDSYRDPRIIIINNDKNLHLPKSLNKGIKIAKGDYIVRMDADDISLEDRFEKQVRFMEEHPDIGASSGNYITIDESGKSIGRSKVLRGKQLDKYYLLPSPLVHPASIIRTYILKNEFMYNELYDSAQDYDLWLSIHDKYRLDNMSDVLIKYRVTQSGISKTKRKQQLYNSWKIFNAHATTKLTEDEFYALIQCRFTVNPLSQNLIYYKIFHTLGYRFWLNSLRYTVHYLKNKVDSLYM